MDAEIPADSRGLLPNLVPPRRLGLILLGLRQARGDSLEDAAARTHGLIDADRLLSLETGEMFANPTELDALAEAYAFQLVDLVPQRVRLVLDYDERLIDAGGFAAVVPEGTMLVEVLQRYLVLVWALRGRQPGSYLQLRELDLEVLGESLDVGTAAVVGILGELLDEQSWVDPYRHPSQFGRPRFGTVVPEAGILLCTGTGGALVFRPDPNAIDEELEAEIEAIAEDVALDELAPPTSSELQWMSGDVPPHPDTALPPPLPLDLTELPMPAPEAVAGFDPDIDLLADVDAEPEAKVEVEPVAEPFREPVPEPEPASEPKAVSEPSSGRSSWLRRRTKKPAAAAVAVPEEPAVPVEAPELRNSAVSLPYFEEDTPPAQPLPWDARNYEAKRKRR